MLTPFSVYRWFPSGKVIFIAPSKPLVAQQIEACHQICGIPGSDAVELVGEVPSKKRIEAVSPKSLTFCTGLNVSIRSGRKSAYFI